MMKKIWTFNGEEDERKIEGREPRTSRKARESGEEKWKVREKKVRKGEKGKYFHLRRRNSFF